MFHNTYMGPFAPNRTLVERGDFLHAHHSPRGKNVACEEVLLIGLCFRARLSRRPSSGGRQWPQYRWYQSVQSQR